MFWRERRAEQGASQSCFTSSQKEFVLQKFLQRHELEVDLNGKHTMC